MAYMMQRAAAGMGGIGAVGVGMLGEYDQMSPKWSWLFWPPPYDFADPDNITPPPTFIAPAAEMRMTSEGLSGCGCGGSCGGCGGGAEAYHDHRGMGQDTFAPIATPGSGLFGTSLFQSGWDISGWGVGEWGIAAVGGYVLFSAVFTTRAAASGVRRRVRKSQSRTRRRRELTDELSGL